MAICADRRGSMFECGPARKSPDFGLARKSAVYGEILLLARKSAATDILASSRFPDYPLPPTLCRYPRRPLQVPREPCNAKRGPEGGSRAGRGRQTGRPGPEIFGARLRAGPVRFPQPAPFRLPPADRFWRHANPVTPNTARQGVAGWVGGPKHFRARPPSLLPPSGPLTPRRACYPLPPTPCRPLSAPREPFNAKHGAAGGSRAGRG